MTTGLPVKPFRNGLGLIGIAADMMSYNIFYSSSLIRNDSRKKDNTTPDILIFKSYNLPILDTPCQHRITIHGLSEQLLSSYSDAYKKLTLSYAMLLNDLLTIVCLNSA
ncbi:hypothetical protein GQX74_007758 [Glossina fuscipes]|nr:hypothetical protein GQX74_007758 [Glossina fuscipes]